MNQPIWTSTTLQPNSHAQERANQYVVEFEESLQRLAETHARSGGTDFIQSVHVNSANSEMLSRRQSLSRGRIFIKETSKILGGAIMGVFLTGIVAIVQTEDALPRSTYLVITGLGVLSAILIMIGVTLEYIEQA